MKRSSRWAPRNRIFLLLAIALATLVIFGIITFLFLGRMQAAAEQTYSSHLSSLQNLQVITGEYENSILAAVQQANQGTITASQARLRMLEGRRSIDSHWEAFLREAQGQDEQGLLPSLEKAMQVANEQVDHLLVSLPLMPDAAFGMLQVEEDVLREQVAVIRSAASRIETLQVAGAWQGAQGIHNAYSLIVALFVILFLVAAAFVVLAVLYLQRSRDALWRQFEPDEDNLGALDVGVPASFPWMDARARRPSAFGSRLADQAPVPRGGEGGWHALTGRVTLLMGKGSEWYRNLVAVIRSRISKTGTVAEAGEASMQEQETTKTAATVTVAEENVAGASASPDESDPSAQVPVLISTMALEISRLADGITSVTQVVRLLEEESNGFGMVLETVMGLTTQTNMLSLRLATKAARAEVQFQTFRSTLRRLGSLAHRLQLAMPGPGPEDAWMWEPSSKRRKRSKKRAPRYELASGKDSSQSSAALWDCGATLAYVREIDRQLQDLRTAVLHFCDYPGTSPESIAVSAHEIVTISEAFDRTLQRVQTIVKRVSESEESLSDASQRMVQTLQALQEKGWTDVPEDGGEGQKLRSQVERMAVTIVTGANAALESVQDLEGQTRLRFERVPDMAQEFPVLSQNMMSSISSMLSMAEDAVWIRRGLGRLLEMVEHVVRRIQQDELLVTGDDVPRECVVLAAEAKEILTRVRSAIGDIGLLMKRIDERYRKMGQHMLGARSGIDDSQASAQGLSATMLEIQQGFGRISTMMSKVASTSATGGFLSSK